MNFKEKKKEEKKKSAIKQTTFPLPYLRPPPPRPRGKIKGEVGDGAPLSSEDWDWTREISGNKL